MSTVKAAPFPGVSHIKVGNLARAIGSLGFYRYARILPLRFRRIERELISIRYEMS